jgi:hypothetical protein
VPPQLLQRLIERCSDALILIARRLGAIARVVKYRPPLLSQRVVRTLYVPNTAAVVVRHQLDALLAELSYLVAIEVVCSDGEAVVS